jgi:YD repeat-containing protein
MLEKTIQKLNLLRIVLFGVLTAVAAVPTLAAQANCDYGYVYQTYESLPFIPGTYNCIPSGVYELLCYVKKTCPPPNAAEETACAECAKATAAHPINLANGNTFIKQLDFALPGLGGGLSLSRTWNSKWPSSQAAVKTGLFGPNWRFNFEERLFLAQDGYLKYSRADGSFWSFGYNTALGKTVVIAPADVVATLTTSGNTDTLTFLDGSKRTFNHVTSTGYDHISCWLKSIVDRNGNTTTVTYDNNNRPIQVTDPATRTITFSYATPSSLLVTSVVSNAGTFTYDYDGEGRLTKVTRPDTTFITFEYDGNSLISAVKDSEGKLLEGHTYDAQGRGLTSTRANGVDSVTISYPPNKDGIIVSNPQ